MPGSPRHGHKYENTLVKGVPCSVPFAKVVNGIDFNASGEYSVHYYELYVDGVKVTEVDPLNFICVINGKDFLEEVRHTLGR